MAYQRKFMKNKLILLLLVFLISISLIGCNLATIKGDEVESLMLETNVEKTKYQSSDPILVSVKLTNTGDNDVVINQRMAINYSSAPKSLREITFTVTGPSGENIPFTAKTNVRRVKTEDLVVLSPGETIEKVYDINLFYNIKNTGVYSISAIYQNSIEIDKNDLTWKDKVISNTTTFEVVP
jgi:hypothetical protein